MADHHVKRRTTKKEIDLKDGKIKLYIDIHVYNENHLKNNNANENESNATATVKSNAGDDEETSTARVHEKRSTYKSRDHKSAILTNLHDKSKKSGKSKRR